MNIESLKIGDKITIRSSSHEPPSIRTVTKVTKTGVTDDKGSRWTLSGREWGSDGYSRSWCEPWKPEHDKQIVEARRACEEKRRRNVVIHFNYSRVDQDTIDRVYLTQP